MNRLFFSKDLSWFELIVGCIGFAKLSGIQVDVFKNATEQHNIADCDTCSVLKPCENYGICQDALTKTGYKCKFFVTPFTKVGFSVCCNLLMQML